MRAILIGIVIVLAIIFGFHAVGVLTKAVTAPGRVLNETLETDNIIQSYEWFYDVNASYTARLNQVEQYKNILTAEADVDEKRRIRIELAAMQQTCRELATKYNANSEKMNKSIFKGWSLPPKLSHQACN